MSRFTNLVCILSLAACEHAAPAQSPPVFPEPPSIVAEPAAPIAEPPAPAPASPSAEAAAEVAPITAPAVAPVKPKPAPKAAPKPVPKAADAKPNFVPFKKTCNPRSRVACRWGEEADERELPRVKKIEGAQ